VSVIAMVCLFVTLWKYELASKHASMRLRALKRSLGGEDAAGPLARTAAPTQI
jgi:heme exporter protein C